ncbi:hypothetical protein GCM10022243_50470 [Saccharothrix violaceirubra]|uniref:Uncharacterized protein n=1 Tax=Saccharothrix violaceirubra TaxID=413306 RepID=A0A7W7SZM6_9PSEU|nr:hypothetical protein [Saccharothrix violaceirubra]MBB4963611.1 hypothetical protein [Saccharothrix violaceirubra]
MSGLSDLRVVIAALFGVYGVVLVVVGLWFTAADDLAAADGFNVNLWAGGGMVALALVFTAWALLRPLRVPEG